VVVVEAAVVAVIAETVAAKAVVTAETKAPAIQA
jgi:hypothetical protein